MTANAPEQPLVDPLVRNPVLIAFGVDVGTEQIMSYHGRVIPLIVGVGVASSSLAMVSSVVVGVGVDDHQPSRYLASPANTGQLMGLLAVLRECRAHGVETVVVERTESVLPHTGALAPEADVYIHIQDADIEVSSTMNPSPMASDLARAWRATAGGPNE